MIIRNVAADLIREIEKFETTSGIGIMMIKSFLISGFILCSAQAASHYVRTGATGKGTGLDWTNACIDFTGSCAVGSLVRGDTYYVAAGTYASRTWNTPAVGTTLITIKHAATADHGTATDWSDSFAGQGVFRNRATISSDYWLFDGVAGDYASGGAASYGFQFNYDIGNAGTQILGNNVTLQYFDCVGYTGSGDYNYPDQAKCIEAYGGNNWTISHFAMHGCESCLQGGGSGWIVQNSYIFNSRSSSPNFHNNIFYCSAASNGIFRYNQVWDYNAEGFFITGYGGTVSNLYIYGNVFSGTGTENLPRGIELRQDYSYSGILIYNNTFSNLTDGGINDLEPTTGNKCTACQAINNVGYLAGFTLGSLVGTTNTDDSTNRFVNLTSRNFQLTAPLPGTALPVLYNLDLTGLIRGADGTWDRGAYEYSSSKTLPGSTLPQPPTNLSVTIR